MSQDVPSRAGTRLLKVGKDELGRFRQGGSTHGERLSTWEVSATDSPSVQVLREAAGYLRTKDVPVGFPTETVYGLGADATRSAAVKGIYTAKGRPSDNPLIVHVSDLDMLRKLLIPQHSANGTANGHRDPIPEIYKPLISKFWPGPLTILLPNPEHSVLAPEVTAGLKTFGARMPSSPLALTLIKLADAPLAAPSANASTRPSATTASDVLEDMNGRIDLILDGGPCQVGVESTVVDGLCDPPGRLEAGWYQSELGKAAPRAPGMKYKHYSPKARVVLYEASYAAGKNGISEDDVGYITQFSQQAKEISSAPTTIGIIRTRSWKAAAGLRTGQFESRKVVEAPEPDIEVDAREAELLYPKADESIGKLLDLSIGTGEKADVIFVEGIPDSDDIAAAVMNRLRKAASEIRS
ncbi:hypothetical protein PG994_011417 [Apiospora phragmitis]|uniref:Threonylcarbamoyl-AMP synthase n=1 Tax=Apiospora phragmitis TaxID=2905665 RepID=A0ABR1TT31_9PEZI